MINDDATGVGAQNWTWAIGQEWCSGSGTSGDPFLIENVTMSIDDASNPCIKIVNSNSSTYFKLSNVTLTNSNAAGNGLWLENCSHGILINCVFSSNGNYGLYMKNVNSTSITSTDCNSNTYGIYCDDCVLNTFTSINASENSDSGLTFINCTYNIVSSSYFQTNTGDGLYIIDSDLNNFTVEASDNGDNGMEIVDSDECIVTNSQFITNNGTGVVLREDDGDTKDNQITNSSFTGNVETNAVDNSTTANDWSSNEWDDYDTKMGNNACDGDDDGIGDIAYTIDGTAGASDPTPTYSDGPEPILTFPEDKDDEWEEFVKGGDIPSETNWTLIAIVCAILLGSVFGIYFLIKYLRKPKSRSHSKARGKLRM